MELREPYTDINRVCEVIRLQIIDSIPYAAENVPHFKNPEQLFNWLKLLVRYKNDPEGYEFIQSMPTLFSDFEHESGEVYKSGEGDCDCFTVATIAAMYVQGEDWIKDFGFVLAGRSPNNPVHIYSYIKFKGKDYILDLTQPRINMVKDYPYTQKMKL